MVPFLHCYDRAFIDLLPGFNGSLDFVLDGVYLCQCLLIHRASVNYTLSLALGWLRFEFWIFPWVLLSSLGLVHPGIPLGSFRAPAPVAVVILAIKGDLLLVHSLVNKGCISAAPGFRLSQRVPRTV